MLPAMWAGDSISVRPMNLADVRPGEVVVFVRDRQFVVHRCVHRTSDAVGVTIVTRGDACLHDDLPLSQDEFLGVVSRVARVVQDRSQAWGPAPLRRMARLIWRPDLARGLVRRILAFVARGTVPHHGLRNTP